MSLFEFLARQVTGDQLMDFVGFGHGHGWWCEAEAEMSELPMWSPALPLRLATNAAMASKGN
jgi:hypothetical protein